MEVNGQQHQKAIKEMDDKLKAVQAQLKGYGHYSYMYR